MVQWTTCNTTLDDLTLDNEVPLWEHGLKFHHLGLIISAVFGLIAVAVSFFLIIQHATHYTRPWEQKHIIRILFMIPIYATVSFLSYLYYLHSIYYEVLRDCYEAFAIASFFTLLCNYLAPNLHEQKEYFRHVTPKNWFWSVFGLQKCTGGQQKGPLRKPRSGLTWFNVVWIGVFQYCFIRVLFTIVSVVTQATDRYCEHSLSPAFAHVWVMSFEGASVTVAMFLLIQFYLQTKGDLAPYRPFLKVACIKLVIFFSFWQSLVISFLSSSVLKPTDKLGYSDINTGIPSMLLCIEMAIFSVMHLFAFPWKPYNPSKALADSYAGESPGLPGTVAKHQGGRFGIRAFADAFNPWDIIKAAARGFRWLFVGRKHRFDDPSYANAVGASGKQGKMDGALAAGTMGPSFAGSGEAATELTPSADSGRNKTGFQGADSDTAGLLSHAQRHGGSPDRMPHEQDMGTKAGLSPPMPSAYGGFDNHAIHPAHRPVQGRTHDDFDEDTSYRGAPSGNEQDIGVAHGGQTAEWDMWAGAKRQDTGDMHPGYSKR